MPIGNPQGYRNTVPPPAGSGNVLSVMQQLEEEKKKRQRQGLLGLLGLAALTGGKGNGGSGGGPTAKSSSSDPIQDAGVGLDLVASLARAGGDKGKAPGVAPAVRRGGSSGKSGAGAAVGAAGSAAGFLSNPVVGAGIAGVTTLASGLLDGDGQEELQKEQLRASRQGDLFNGIRSMTDGIRRRNEELRSALHGYGR